MNRAKFKQVQSLTEAILLMLYDRTAKYRHGDWSLESAFEAIGRDDFRESGDAVLNRLVDRGWITCQTTVRLQGEQHSVSLTDRGRLAAIQLLEAKEPQTFLQRLHSLNWATWGGIAAIIAAIASVIGVIFAVKAVN